ncbi:helix-turn-helix domain-containing protein [uncultured Eubacterium sp.]|uniref:helix-turn-helix domain-containing protein n=1 Tax=uncultured Eubacterium sp. TaxID=165185 RepID=UPI0015AB2258|nr:helix-turn-helix domain-containing protein [uncultured Eubacterium sp.]
MKNENEKLSKFSEILSKMRKERGISQKKAASDLGISQALLSHYEKGIRECGLDFVIKCSKYYGVTTDYLLGVSENRNGMSNDVLANIQSADGRSAKALAMSTKYLLEMASAATDGKKDNYVYDYFMLCAYRGALTLAKAGVLPKELFKIDYTIARDLASAAIALQDARFVFIEDKSRTGIDEAEFAPLKDMISEAEEYILSNYITI